MKKFLAILVAVMMVLSLVSAMADDATGAYTVYNGTGEAVTELYLYPVGSEDKGENLAAFHGASMNLTYTGAADTQLVLEFVTESGYTGHFDTLAIEEAPITLLSADAMTGATMISFTVPINTGVYTIYNGTGENLAEMYLYPAGTEDKGKNLAEEFEDGKEFSYTAPQNVVLTLEFVTESGYTGSFDTLNIEVAPITLLSADAMTGATMISFTAPEAK